MEGYMYTKKKLYPKTERIKKDLLKFQVTEKLDGSNLGIFNKGNGILIIATRNNVFEINEEADLNAFKHFFYKGLMEWLQKHFKSLINDLHVGSGIFGEWIGMGQLKYKERIDKQFYMFAKATISTDDYDYKISNLMYDTSLFIYPFIKQVIPDYIDVVPLVKEIYTTSIDIIKELDDLYETYTKAVDDVVEGFVISIDNQVTKYVRNKGGKLQEHRE